MKKIECIIFICFITNFFSVYAQTIPNIFFDTICDSGFYYSNKIEDTFFVKIYWEIGNVSLSEHSKFKIDSLISNVNINKDSIDIIYWDYECSCNSVLLFKRRSYYLFDYIKSKTRLRNMYVYYNILDCEALLKKHCDLSSYRGLFLSIPSKKL